MFGKTVWLFIISLFLASSMGCMATFASLEPEQPSDSSGRPSLYVAVTSETLHLNNVDQSVPLLFDPDYTDDVMNALHACDCYATVETSPGSYDFEASVRVRRVVHNKSALINLITAMLIPAVEDRQIAVQVQIKNLDSNAEASAERVRSFRVWYQLFLLPVYPFKSPAAFEMRLLPQLIREAVSEAIARTRDSAA